MSQRFRCNEFGSAKAARRLAYLVIVLTTVFVSACETQVSVERISLPTPVVEKLPLTVGVNYTDDFRVGERQGYDCYQGHKEFDFSLGPGSVDLFDQVIHSIFDNVVSVPNTQLPLDQQPSPVLILKPSRYVRVKCDYSGSPMHLRFGVNYYVNFYDADGTKLGHWDVWGWAYEIEKIETAMRRAAARLLSELPDQEPVQSALVRSESRVDAVYGTGQDVLR